jgi:hypothetical protein
LGSKAKVSRRLKRLAYRPNRPVVGKRGQCTVTRLASGYIGGDGTVS